MPGIIDDLKGVMSAEEFAKLEANATLKTRITRGEELRSFYDGDEVPAVADPPATVEPPARTAPAGTGGQFDLSAIERMLDTKLATINTTIETKIADVVKTRGDELVNNAVKIAVQRTDELSRIYIEHNQNYSEPFDSSKFNEYLEANKDKGFRTIRQAYDAWVSPRAMEREVDKKVKEKLAAQSGPNVPGTTPAPATNTNIRHFMKRTGTGAAATETGASRAAAMLDRLEASRAQNVA